AEQAAGDLGRLAEAHRQQAGGQGVEAAGVAGLAGAEQVAYALQRLVGAEPARLVEQQDAVEAAEPGARRFAHAGIVDASHVPKLLQERLRRMGRAKRNPSSRMALSRGAMGFAFGSTHPTGWCAPVPCNRRQVKPWMDAAPAYG